MTVELVQAVLGWCSLINYAILIWWFVWISLAHDWVYSVQGQWFKVTREQFDILHYAGITFFKLFIFVFNIVPYLALRIAHG